jgi:hypothetical protein
MASLTATQLPTPVVVAVSVMLPFAISVAVGMYTGFTAVLPGVKVPAPPLQMMPVATGVSADQGGRSRCCRKAFGPDQHVTVGAGVMLKVT